jgi:hypothetical protein
MGVGLWGAVNDIRESPFDGAEGFHSAVAARSVPFQPTRSFATEVGDA